VNKRLGTRAVANWLNSHGHRTRLGRPWSQVTVFDVLRNPVQVGRIAFRGASHEAQYEALIEPSLFEAADRLLAERGEVAGKRRSRGTEYLLSGLIRCGQCGKPLPGDSRPRAQSRLSLLHLLLAQPLRAPTAARPTGCQRTLSIKPRWSQYLRPTRTLTSSSQRFGALA